MKIVVNKCYGGYSLSHKAIARYYELKGLKVYHFKDDYSKGHGIDNKKYILVKEGDESLFTISFSVPNPNDFDSKELWSKYYLDSRPEDRTDPLLIQTIEELGEKESSGSCASLRIIEIPDNVNYEIDDYDGIESIHETHRSW